MVANQQCGAVTHNVLRRGCCAAQKQLPLRVYRLSDSCEICKLLRESELYFFSRVSAYQVPNWSLTTHLAASNSLVAADDRHGHVCALGD